MRFDVITLFPELFEPFLASGVTRRAYATGQVQVRLWSLRDHAEGNYRRVDDRPFGGGPGMVMMAEPLARCLAAIRADRAEAQAAPLVLFSPIGRRLDHAAVQDWSAGAGAVLLCGRYEGVDQRFIDAHVDMQISLGDFVLSGGEIAAMALLDSVARLQPGVLHDEGSHQLDSFNPALDGLLDCHKLRELTRTKEADDLLSKLKLYMKPDTNPLGLSIAAIAAGGKVLLSLLLVLWTVFP